MKDGRKNNGGARPGAGRKPTGNPKATAFRFAPEVLDKLKELSAKYNKSQAKILTDLIMAAE